MKRNRIYLANAIAVVVTLGVTASGLSTAAVYAENFQPIKPIASLYSGNSLGLQINGERVPDGLYGYYFNQNLRTMAAGSSVDLVFRPNGVVDENKVKELKQRTENDLKNLFAQREFLNIENITLSAKEQQQITRKGITDYDLTPELQWEYIEKHAALMDKLYDKMFGANANTEGILRYNAIFVPYNNTYTSDYNDRYYNDKYYNDRYNMSYDDWNRRYGKNGSSTDSDYESWFNRYSSGREKDKYTEKYYREYVKYMNDKYRTDDRYYNYNYNNRERNLVRSDQAAIDDAMRRIRRGEDFDSVASEYAKKYTAVAYDTAGSYLNKDETSKREIYRAVSALKDNQNTGVFEASGGYYIVKRLEMDLTQYTKTLHDKARLDPKTKAEYDRLLQSIASTSKASKVFKDQASYDKITYNSF